jgi:hypothetical protein
MRTEAECQAAIIAIRKQRGSDKVFGASGKSGHNFELTPASAGEIERLEKELSVKLPPEYSRLLMECGWGAGPYYGLYCPSRVLREVRSLNDNLAANDKLAHPNLDFPFRKGDALIVLQRMGNHESEPYLRASWLCDGCIPIGEQGCTGYNVLVTAGELRGTIWSVNDDGAVAQWWPGGRPPGLLGEGSFNSGRFVPTFVPRSLPAIPSPPTLPQWYGSWLERVETDLDDYAEFVRRE